MEMPNADAGGPAPANPGVIAASGDPVNPLRDPRDPAISRVTQRVGRVDAGRDHPGVSRRRTPSAGVRHVHDRNLL